MPNPKLPVSENWRWPDGTQVEVDSANAAAVRDAGSVTVPAAALDKLRRERVGLLRTLAELLDSHEAMAWAQLDERMIAARNRWLPDLALRPRDE